MVELMTFIGNLNLGTFIVLWTSTILFVICVSLLLFYIRQMNKEANTIRKKVKILTAGLSEEKNKTWKL
jgi:hypothetical protein